MGYVVQAAVLAGVPSRTAAILMSVRSTAVVCACKRGMALRCCALGCISIMCLCTTDIRLVRAHYHCMTACQEQGI